MRRLFGWALTFRLWRQFWGRIPDHPLALTIKPKRAQSGDSGCSPMVIGALLLLGLPVLWAVGFGLALMAIVVGGTLRGAVVAALTARAVYHERGTGHLDLLGLTPAGILGVGWVLAQREFRLSASGQFVNRYVQNAQRIVGTGAVVMVSLIIAGTLIFQLEGVADVDGGGITPALEYVLGAGQLVSVVVLWLFIDNAQSPLIGVLVGIWAGAGARRKPEASALGASVFAIMQLGLFAAAFAVWTLADGLPDGVRLALPVALMIGTREILLRAAWRALCHHLNASGAEVAAVLRL